MDLASIKAQIEKSRELDTEYGGVKFLLRLPSEHAWRLITEDHRDANGRVQHARVSRSLVERSVIGWEGLKAEFLLKGSGDEAVPFSPDALALLMDERQDVEDHLVKLLTKKFNKRRIEQEASRKN
jgi:hypothetical protein